ncbi:metal-dependent hydrolase [Haloechinothrix sp. YIM 98757]|uniref:Metal-dependent hydrolase n=1 Tax=Haloechinothrix aidingensis TaxID=2752311 RepID=A0A838A9X7_9PSEU|nr:metal-dependent hydrolase [Haloechinothrix aidingensis]MBA0125739.1 metal-dependent hydrolase [Haloechinothrix aidingensis]
MAADNEVEPGEEQLVLHPRPVRFDWSNLPLHWVPCDPQTTHTINVLHLLLPEGERWFVRVFKQALPLIADERLRTDVLGFIGQEALHAEAHSGVADHLAAHGLDASPFTRQVEWMFRRLLGDRDLHGKAAEEWLVERLAIIAAIEHFTAFLGQWILDASGLDAAGADPTMLDLLRWHGAEEVEHRSVAYDLFCHLDGRYTRRARAMSVVAPVMLWLFVRGTRFLMRNDPQLGGRDKARLRRLRAASARGTLPTLRGVLGEVRPYFTRSFHPSRYGSTERAIGYLASSPAAQAAEAQQ